MPVGAIKSGGGAEKDGESGRKRAVRPGDVGEQKRGLRLPSGKPVTIALVLIAALAGTILLCRSSKASPIELTSAGLVPNDTVLYVAVNTDLDSSQWVSAFKLAEKFGAEDPEQQMQDGATSSGFDWDDDVKPFLGGDAAIFVRGAFDAEGGIDAGVILRCSNTTKAIAVIREKAAEQGVTLEKRTYAGGFYEADDLNGAYVAVLDDHIVITANEQTVRDVVDTYRGEHTSLKDSEAFQSVRDQVVQDFLAFTFVDPSQVAAGDEEFSARLAEAGLFSLEGAAFGGALTADSDVFSLEQAFPSPEPEFAALLQPRSPKFASRVPENTSLFVSTHGLGPLVTKARAASDEQTDAGAEAAAGLADVGWLFAGAPFELGEMEDLAELITGEMAVASWPPSDTSAGGSVLLGEVDDPEAARALATNLAAGDLDYDTRTTETIGGFEVTVVGEGAVAGGRRRADRRFAGRCQDRHRRARHVACGLPRVPARIRSPGDLPRFIHLPQRRGALQLRRARCRSRGPDHAGTRVRDLERGPGERHNADLRRGACERRVSMHWSRTLSLFAGPLVLAGFFLPWFEGHGVLAGERYNGYDLLQFGAWLQEAGIGSRAELGLQVGRVLAVGLFVSGLWLTFLGLVMREHRLYAIAGWYVFASALLLTVASIAWHAYPVPLPGVLALICAAVLWMLPGLRWPSEIRSGQRRW